VSAELRRDWLTGVGVAGTILIASGAFVLSFTALTDLAASAGIRPSLTWIWPLIVDGLIVVSTIGAVALAGRTGVWYCWMLLIGASGLSVTANAIHATLHATAVAGWLASVIAAVPPLVLLAVTHLTVVIGRPTPTQPVNQPPNHQAVTTDQTKTVPDHNAPLSPVKTPADNLANPTLKPTNPDVPPSAQNSVTPRDFVISYLRAHGRIAPANQVTQAGLNSGFTAEQIRVARRRCNPPITSTATADGWIWAIDDTKAKLAPATT